MGWQDFQDAVKRQNGRWTTDKPLLPGIVLGKLGEEVIGQYHPSPDKVAGDAWAVFQRHKNGILANLYEFSAYDSPLRTSGSRVVLGRSVQEIVDLIDARYPGIVAGKDKPGTIVGPSLEFPEEEDVVHPVVVSTGDANLSNVADAAIAAAMLRKPAPAVPVPGRGGGVEKWVLVLTLGAIAAAFIAAKR